MSAGANNAHWFVGGRFVLRRYNGLRSLTMIDYEHRVLDHLRDGGWPVAAPLPALDGRTVVADDDGRYYALFPRLAGRTGNGARPRNPVALGRLLARLHNDLEQVAKEVTAPSPPAVFPPALSIAVDPIWEHLSAVPDRALSAAVRRAVDNLAGDVAGIDAVPSGIVHGDWSDNQILYRGGKVTGVLDFDFVHPDLLAVDLAIATTKIDVAAGVQMVTGYRTERDLSSAELAVMGMARRAGRLQYIWPSLNALATGDLSAIDGIRFQLAKHDEAEDAWPTLLAAIS